jgi:tetratricopeptide (TPR) repeat protein
VIFSEFLTRQSLDELVEPFMRMLDDLTPYYQARMASLSPQQRKIVEFLCDRRHGVPVKEIAQRCFLTHQTTSSQLKDLREKGYVMSDAIGRESFYEMRETLMRFCLEVKKQRGEPIQLFVDFLRIWYTKEELLQRLGLTVAEFRKNRVFDDLGKDNYLQSQQRLKPLPSDAVLEREYILYALEAMDNEDEDPRIAACLQEYENCFEKEDYVTALELAEKLVKIRGQAEDWLKRGLCLSNLKRYEKALVSCDKAIELAPHYAPAWGLRGAVLATIERYEEALVSCDKAIELEPDDASAWGLRGWVLDKLKRDEEALVSCDKAIELDPNYAPSWELRGTLLEDLKRYEEALISCDKIIELEPNDTRAWGMRGVVLADLERYEEALVSCDKAIELGYQDSSVFLNRAIAILGLNRWDEGIAALENAFQRFTLDNEADADDAKLIMHILFNSSNNVEIWRSRIKTLIELYHKHQVISTLGQGLVKSVPTLMSEMVSDKAAQTWLEVWQELASDYPEFQIPLRLLKAAVGYKETKGNKRVLFSLPIEERKLLEPLLGIADTSAVK